LHAPSNGLLVTQGSCCVINEELQRIPIPSSRKVTGYFEGKGVSKAKAKISKWMQSRKKI